MTMHQRQSRRIRAAESSALINYDNCLTG